MHRVRKTYRICRPIIIPVTTDSGNKQIYLGTGDTMTVIDNSSMIVIQNKKDAWKRPYTPVMIAVKTSQGTNVGEIVHELCARLYISLEAEKVFDD